MNNYEQRFQSSLQKLTIPSWYAEAVSGSNALKNSKQSIISTSSISYKFDDREPLRVPEISYVRLPPHYRSCRTSIATSPSPSVHSWHPNYLMDTTRQRRHYEKGIDRVSKSSRWYQPTQFNANATEDSQTGNTKVSASNKHKHQSSKNNHYTSPQIHGNHESFALNSNRSVTNGDTEENIVTEQTIKTITKEQLQDDRIKSNESQIMPVAIKHEPSSCIELKPVTHEECYYQSPPMKTSNRIPSITNLPMPMEQVDHSTDLLERVANDLVETVLADALVLYGTDYDDDKNSGVRELSEDENGLRELDENDMNDTDEFIVFATTPDLINNNIDDNTNGNTNDDDQASNMPRCSLNKLYTFSRPSHNGANNPKETTSNQNSSIHILEESTIATNSLPNSTIEQSFDNAFPATFICQSYIEPQPITLDQYIDEIVHPSNSQLARHQSSEGVNEETARIGRLLLNSIPTTFIHDIHNLSQIPISTEPISSNPSTRCITSDQSDIYDSPRIDTCSSERKTIEEYDEELNDENHRDSAYSSNQERINIQQSLYEPLSECFSGYCYVQSDFLTPNISSLQSTTDEAYESEPTTMSSSIAITTYIHPSLEHEFEYPAPPPPVPDRRLKPDHLKPSVRKSEPVKQDIIDTNVCNSNQNSKPLPLTAIQQLIAPITKDSNSTSGRTMSSRYYCGSIPASDKLTITSPTSPTTKPRDNSIDKTKEKRNSRVLSCLHSSAMDDGDRNHRNAKRSILTKSSHSPSRRLKTKKSKIITDFDEATNGLAIRLPAPNDTSLDKQKTNRISTSLLTKRTPGTSKDQHTTDNIKSDRTVFYETSV